MTDTVSVTLIQMKIASSVEHNLAHAEELIALSKGSIVVLPEMFCCEYNNHSFRTNAQPAGGPIYKFLSRSAQKYGNLLVGGSFPELDAGKIYNTCFVFDRNGVQIARHRKKHLFDINIHGGQSFRESDTFSSGNTTTVFDSEFGPLGIAVCFDIRFPTQFTDMAERGARAVFVPAAFNMTTGPLHWELLFRSRAADNQFFIFGTAPARDTSAGYVSYANSIAVDPWGRVISRAGEDERLIEVDVDLSQVCSVREQIPLFKNGIRIR